MTFSGIGQPGQRETTRAGLETGYSLVVRQVKAAILLGWLMIFLLLVGIFAFWAKSDSRAALHWIGEHWPWLFAPFIFWAFVPSSFGIWRFIAEITDPTYPTPRVPTPEVQRDGPRWPWLGEPLYADDDEPAPPQRRVEVVLKSNNGRTIQYADLPDLRGLPTFASLVLGGRSFSVRTAQGCGLTRAQFDQMRDTMLAKGWAEWKGGDKRQGIEVTRQGKAVLRHLATPSPTLAEVV